jgi:hypothetical protein
MQRDMIQPSSDRDHAVDALRESTLPLGIVLHAAINYLPLRMTPSAQPER